MERKFAERGVVGSGDAMAALAILRSLIAVLVASDKVNLNDVDWALRLAEGEIGSGNNEGRKEARRLIADFRAWIIEWKAARGATVSP
jgi:hypothetical protein